MSNATRSSAKHWLNHETLRFLVVGCTTVAIDYLTYKLLLLARLDVSLAKGMSFGIGAVFAFFANKSITFQVAGTPSVNQFFRFALLYLTTLGLNVWSNALALNLPQQLLPKFQVQLAFLLATGVSTITNFLGMKFLVFPKTAVRVDSQC